MAWYEDLSPCGYFGQECSGFLRSVGWLENGHPFASGRVDVEVYQRLVDMCQNPWQPGLFLGFHRCDYCLYEGSSGKKNLFIPTGDSVFVCPELITHYMNAPAIDRPVSFARQCWPARRCGRCRI